MFLSFNQIGSSDEKTSIVDRRRIETMDGTTVNAKSLNTGGSTWTANETVFNDRVSNQTGGKMTLTNSVLNENLYSFYDKSEISLNGVQVVGGMELSNSIHIGEKGVQGIGSNTYARFYDEGSITLTLTDSLLSSRWKNDNHSIEFYLSDFITDANFYWADESWAYRTGLNDYWDNFLFSFDFSSLTDSEYWEDMLADISTSGIGYDFDSKSWLDSGVAWDVKFYLLGTNEGGEFAATPEPASMLVFGAGLAGL